MKTTQRTRWAALAGWLVACGPRVPTERDASRDGVAVLDREAPTDVAPPSDLFDAGDTSLPDGCSTEGGSGDAFPCDPKDAGAEAPDGTPDARPDVAAPVEQCNGLDDDGDGIVDNLVAGPCAPTPCQVGQTECRTGIPAGASEAPTCVPGGFAPTSTLCRPAAGACDAPEYCTGRYAFCPPDLTLASTVVCRPSAGSCDGQEFCTGGGPQCPADTRLAAGATCGAGGLTCTAVGGCGVCTAGELPCNGRCVGIGGACAAGVGACARHGVLACGEARLMAIAPGLYTNCALLRDGTVNCWGESADGALGVGPVAEASLVTRSVPVAALTDGVSLAAGYRFTCALLRDGTVRCWGRNDEGMLGAGVTEPSRNTPVPVVGLTQVTQLSAGNSAACAVRSDGTVWCWGFNGHGELGDGTYVSRRSPVQVLDLTSVAAVSVGAQQTCALKTDGTVWCWGRPDLRMTGSTATRNRPAPMEGVVGAVEVAAGGNVTCVRLASGAVQCWGDNTYGQLGNGMTGDPVVPMVTVAGVTNATALAAGSMHVCALLADGNVRCWGFNGNGQRGIGTTGTVPTAQVFVLGVSDAAQIAGRAETTCAVLRDGSARCWGHGGGGVRGDGRQDLSGVATRVTVVSAPACSAVPGAPSGEVCNRVDDDCDGLTDEGCP